MELLTVRLRSVNNYFMATNEQIVIKAAMAILGSRTSAAKKRSSRLNGAKRKRRANPENQSKIKKNKSVARANG